MPTTDSITSTLYRTHGSDLEFMEWFWQRVTKTDSCWNWTGARHSEGYGKVHVSASGNSHNLFAHRLAWISVNGDVPKGLVIHHTCHNRSCVNPEHLATIPRGENAREGNHRGDAGRFVQGSTNWRAVVPVPTEPRKRTIRTVNPEKRFWSKVKKTETCWLWQGAPDNKRGYARIYVAGNGIAVHRFSWVLLHGPIPEGLVVRHRCDVPNCVNPEHLELGTPADNNRDKVERGRQARGERIRKDGLTEIQVVEMLDLYVDGAAPRDLARRFGVTKSSVICVVNRTSWSHVPYLREEELASRRAACRDRRGSRHGMAKLTEADIPTIRSLCAGGLSQREIALRYGVSTSTVMRLATGKTWTHVS